MYNVDIESVDFNRITNVFVTKRVSGQYYFAQQVGEDLKWVRQVHEEEVKPLFVCPIAMAKSIAAAMNQRFRVPHSEN